MRATADGIRMRNIKPLPWVVLTIVVIAGGWYLLRTAALAIEHRFPGWLAGRAFIAFLVIAFVAAAVKVIVLDRIRRSK